MILRVVSIYRPLGYEPSALPLSYEAFIYQKNEFLKKANQRDEVQQSKYTSFPPNVHGQNRTVQLQRGRLV